MPVASELKVTIRGRPNSLVIAATWLPTEPLLTFRLTDAAGETVETPQIPRFGHATLYKMGFLLKSPPRSRPELSRFQGIRSNGG